MATLQHCGGDPDPALPGDVDAGADSSRPRERRDSAPPTDDPPEEDLRTKGPGSRFRPLDIEVAYDDGSRARYFASAFIDGRLNEPCSIEENGSGGYACLPSRRRGIEAFTDKDCKTPAVAATNSDEFLWEEEHYVEVGPACSPRIALSEGHTRGEAFIKDARGFCVRHSYDGWIVPNPKIVPISSFGSFTRSKDTRALPGEQAGSRLVLEAWRFTGEDGSFEVRPPRIVDSARKSAGQIFTAKDGRLRFFTAFNKVHEDFPRIFADSTCTTKALAFEKDHAGCEEDPPFSNDGLIREEVPATGCVTMKEVVPPTSAPLSSVYGSYSGACLESEPPSSTTKYYPAPAVVEVPNDALAEITEEIVASERIARSGPRLEARIRVRSSADGLKLEDRDAQLYLRNFDLPCHLGIVGDDFEPRCIPDVPWLDDSTNYFADAECTEAVIALRSSELCGPPSPLYRGPGTVFRIYRRQGDSVSTVYTKPFGGSCILLEKPSMGLRFYRRGPLEQVPATDFPLMLSNKYVLSR